MKNRFYSLLQQWLGLRDIPKVEPGSTLENPRKPMKISDAALALVSRPKPGRMRFPSIHEVKPPDMMKGVVRESQKIAMDRKAFNIYEFANQAFAGQGFIGYAILAELTQVHEYRVMGARLAQEMTRKWIEFKTTSDDDGDDKTKKINKIEAAMRKYEIRAKFRKCAEHDANFGRCQLFPDFGDSDDLELKTPLILSPAKIKKGSLRGFRIIEPAWTYPMDYNSSDPLDSWFFRPSMWYVMARPIHDSRLIMFNSRPVPDMLKPAYNFGGVPLLQMAIPTVENWLDTRSNVNQVISNFRTRGFKTDMSDVLSGGEGTQLLTRVELFNRYSDNHATMLFDVERKEEYVEKNTNLTNLDKLLTQAQEHMAAIAQMPKVVLLGETPAGLSASSEGEIRVFYDYVHDIQEALFRGPLEHVLKIIQLDLFGEIDEDIMFEFLPLRQMDDEALARIKKTESEAADIYVNNVGALTNEEVRRKLAKDPTSGYSLDPDVKLQPPPDPEPVKVGTGSN